MPRCARRIDLVLPDGPIAALEGRPEGRAAATALLVPGFTGSKEDFLPLLEPLADAGIRAVAVDQRGQCDSPGLADPTRYGIEYFGADIRHLIALLAGTTAGGEAAGDGPPRLHLLGHSFGGHAVREAVLSAPERLPLASVTILDSGPGKVVGPSRDQAQLFLDASQSLTQQQIQEIQPMDVHEDADVRAFLLHRWLSNDPASMRAIAEQLLVEPDRTEELRAALDAWSLPRLVATGANDDVWSAASQEDVALRLGARFAVVPEAGHSPNTQQPEALAKVLLGFWLG